jgi:superfamily II helicase
MSLKDALKKAGFSNVKDENERKHKIKKEVTKSEKHQEHRNFCEVCEFIQPDVERFRHKHPRIDAEWICSNCADKNEILDEFRLTNQSDSARNGGYRRYYGPIKDFSKEKGYVQKPRENQKKSSRGNKKDQSSRFNVDDDGEKNFNC